ncbi:MAG: uroporphyrinogen decarboxylase family protein [Limnochordia bacterium]
MQNRERILSLIENQPIDGIVWAPRLKLWYDYHKVQGTLPEQYRDIDIMEMEKRLGSAAASTARLGFKSRTGSAQGHILRPRFNKVTVSTEVVDDKKYVTYKTPVGSVREVFSINREAVEKGLPLQFQEQQVKRMFDSPDDYKVIEYIYTDVEYDATYDEYLEFEAALGDHGVPIVSLHYDPMFLIMQELIGLNQFYFELYDNKQMVERLYRVVCEKYSEVQTIAINSPARIFLVGFHYDYRMVPPSLYAEYMSPYLEPFGRRLKAAGKLMGLHADADITGLLQQIKDSGFDYLDCLSTAPMSSLTIEQALEEFTDYAIIYGGIPSNMLVPMCCPDEAFRAYILDLLETLQQTKCRIILGAADNVMPEADIGRVEWVSELLKTR